MPDLADLPQRLAESAAHLPEPVTAVEDWLADRRVRCPFRVDRVPFDQLDGWLFDEETGDLVHRTGRFFAVEGVRIRTNHGTIPEWTQPIIHQEDVAILGILAKQLDGVLHFLMQAKMEPGNVNTVQVSPTVQATSSNYERAHRGAYSRYVEYFTEPGMAHVLVDVLQSEQGSWFRGKRNRNIVVEVTGEVEPHDDFRWLTLGQLLELLHHPHLINMDARTVLSCLPLTDSPAGPVERIEVRNWLTTQKAGYALTADRLPLNQVREWRRDAVRVFHPSGKYFEVVGARIQATNREVANWCQPLLAPRGTGLAAFVLRDFDGVTKLLARADVRAGYRDVVEVGPTVQCTPANYKDRPSPRYLDLVESPEVRVLYDVVQSEEGGRFSSALTRHLLVEAGPEFGEDLPKGFMWLTADELAGLARSSYQVDIEARSLLLCLRAMGKLR
ncbi:NDP-hexose 2,3-dehydratase family protein [Nocardia transvalensis]|uniref:NDP-hexose 2,3-dehydratase family protein n=1 Tax=Nocardia transvalensis TaxID=37333 RepID=UPI001895FEC2|nr:NDP-hexose 2,3-dehydratase family protein [Nocardia transvalensis]MBF6329819.1 NDP-hexose 2,3-dehydratase family protein [Nocardia transvalensis]